MSKKKELDGCALPAQLYTNEAKASVEKTQQELDAKLEDNDDVFAALVSDAANQKQHEGTE